MPTFKKFISQSPQDFGAALQISGFHIANESTSAPNSDPLNYNSSLAVFSGGSGISSSDISAGNIRVSSGEFFVRDPLVSWYLVNPADNTAFTPEEVYSLTAFSGFKITLKDETGRFINELVTGGFRGTEFQFASKDLSTLFAPFELPDREGLDTTKRKFRFEVSSTDYYGRSNTGVYFLTSKSPDITGCDVEVGSDVSFNFKSTKTSGLRHLDVYASTTEDFKVIQKSGFKTADFKYRFDLAGQDQQSLNVSISPPVESGYFYAAVLSDNFGSGTPYYYPSSIKPFTVDPLLYNFNVSGLEGRVIACRDTFNKSVDSNIVCKFMRDLSNADNQYEAKILATGTMCDESSYFTLGTPQAKGISRFIHGTGTSRIDKRFFDVNKTLQDYAYSGNAATPIFSAYQTTGVQLLDHTIILDPSEVVPSAFATGENSVFEVAIAAGNSVSSKLFWGGAYDTGRNEFVFYPSGGLISGSIYSGTYLGEPTGGAFDYGPSGPQGGLEGTGALVTGLTGSLVVTNYSGLIVPEYEPHFLHPVKNYADYEISIRTVIEDENGITQTPFSDPIKFTSGDITAGITGGGFFTGLFNGDTDSGVAVYNQSSDILNISSAVTLDDDGIPVQISKAGTTDEKETLKADLFIDCTGWSTMA